jgi:hypothetical protein
MSTTLNAYIRPSSRFYGKYEVVRHVATAQVDGLYQTIEEEVIPCHNLSTARSYIEGTREYAIMQRQASNVTRNVTQPSVEVIGFCSPSGQHYAVVEMPDMDVRIDCHNSATLRTWLRDGVSPETLIEALQDESNIRRTGGWHG